MVWPRWFFSFLESWVSPTGEVLILFDYNPDLQSELDISHHPPCEELVLFSEQWCRPSPPRRRIHIHSEPWRRPIGKPTLGPKRNHTCPLSILHSLRRSAGSAGIGYTSSCTQQPIPARSKPFLHSPSAVSAGVRWELRTPCNWPILSRFCS